MRRLLVTVIVLGALVVPAGPAAAEAWCFTDEPEAANPPPVDLTTLCVVYDQSLRASWQMEDPGDPRASSFFNGAGGRDRSSGLMEMYGEFGDGSATVTYLSWEVGTDGQLDVWLGDPEGYPYDPQQCGLAVTYRDGWVVATVGNVRCIGDTRLDITPSVYNAVDDRSDTIGGSSDYATIYPHGMDPIARLAGANRYATAAAVAERAYPDPTDVVYLARADQFADAVAGGSLSDGPVLLVPPCSGVPDPVVEQIARLNPSEVVALGGSGAVCDATLDEAANGRDTARLAGASRIETAVAIARRAFPSGAATVYLARHDVLTDALAGGTLPDGPTVLVPSCGGLPQPVADLLSEYAPDQVIALGGTTAVCPAQLDAAVRAAGDGTAGRRLSGESRFETAAEIARRRLELAPATHLYAVNATRQADAVVAGALTDGPVLFVQPCGYPGFAPADVARTRRWDAVIGIGGSAVLCHTPLAILAQPWPAERD